MDKIIENITEPQYVMWIFIAIIVIISKFCMVLKYLLQERDIENSIGYGYRMRKIIEHAKISLRQKAVEYYGWSYIRSMFA